MPQLTLERHLQQQQKAVDNLGNMHPIRAAQLLVHMHNFMQVPGVLSVLKHRSEGVRDLELIEIEQRRLPALQAAFVGGTAADQTLCSAR